MKKILIIHSNMELGGAETSLLGLLYALEHYGLPIPSREQLRTIVGPPLHESFVRFGVPEE